MRIIIPDIALLMKGVLVMPQISHPIHFDVPNGITHVSMRLSKGLKGITLPSGVRYIDLSLCEQLRELTLPDSVEALMLDDCIALSHLTLPANLRVFCARRTGLKTLDVPQNIRFQELSNISQEKFTLSGEALRDILSNPSSLSVFCLNSIHSILSDVKTYNVRTHSV